MTPVYDGVTMPQQAPYPAACIASAKRCQCYSQQSTKLDMSDELCRKLADGGFFVAWAANGERVQQQPQQAPQAAPQALGERLGQGAGSFGPPPAQIAAATVQPDAGPVARRMERTAQ
ncbi:hypothetical protein ACS5PN_03920 [Roseateles sp. NT4]|uniref:hypothetical protein n=1 Tax=Roseateles sp. NT4 TaxID=3453715 RepID=UPI003EEA35AB